MKTIKAFVVLGLMSVGCSDGQFEGATASKTYDSSNAQVAQAEQEGESSGSSTGSTSSTTVDESERAALTGSCSESKKGGASKSYHVSSSSQVITLSALENPYIKVTGTHNKVTIKIAPNQAIASICLDIMGDENKFFFEIDGKVAEIGIKARGNVPVIDILTNANASLERVRFDDKGNKPSLVMHGEGKYNCEARDGIVCK